jgi:UDP-N-acetylmuramoylalanine--D-glutamate ligase
MTGRSTLIIGLGVTGLSCVRHLAGTDRLRVVDTRPEPPGLQALRAAHPEVSVETGVSSVSFEGFDRVLVSPGVGLDSPLLVNRPADVPIVSDVDLFCEAAAAPIVAVTGTNGKSTVTALTGHILSRSGLNAVAGGNLGDAALDLLRDDVEAYVVELSSFQLERLGVHHFEAATILNVTEDHLDRHGTMEAYTAAKHRIYRDCDLAVYNRDDAATMPPSDHRRVSVGLDAPKAGDWGVRESGGERWLVWGDREIVASSRLPIAGRHNEVNVLAAMALASSLSVTPECMADAVSSFTGLPHRCERVGTIRGVEYVNDSKATNVGATRAALLGLGGESRRIVLIAGGDGKQADFTPLRDAVCRHVKSLILIGRDGPLISEALAGCCEMQSVSSLPEAVRLAADITAAGDLVLLSPACASFDMFTNFSERGDVFRHSVEDLAA